MRATPRRQRRNNADLLVESGTPASALHQGEEEMNISHRDEEKGSWSWGVTADTQPTVAFPACIFQLYFNPYSQQKQTSLPAATKSVLCFRVPTQSCQIRAEVNLIRCNGWQRAHKHTGMHATVQTISHALKYEHMVGGGLQRQSFDIFIKVL